MEQLYQDKHSRRVKSTYTQHKNRSRTDSLESYQNGAEKEVLILRRNNRVPTADVVIHFLNERSVAAINTARTKIFRYLKEHGVEAVANIELTVDKHGSPNNCVHFHCITDDKRRRKEIRALFITACERAGLVRGKDFRVTYWTLYDGYSYLNYFTKYGFSKKVILFQKDIGLNKFYQIGQWFQKDRGKGEIWAEIQQETAERQRVYEESLHHFYTLAVEEQRYTAEMEGFIDQYLQDRDKTSGGEATEDFVEIKSADLEGHSVKIVPQWNQYPYSIPKDNTVDIRNEWRRFAHSVAFLR